MRVPNSRLLRRGAFEALDAYVGHRAIFMPGQACPRQEAEQCEAGRDWCGSCRVTASNLFHNRYEEPRQESVSDTVYRKWASSNPDYREEISHAWPLTTPVATHGEEQYRFGEDFDIVGREIIWLGERRPPDGEWYTVTYEAYEEEKLAILHVNQGAAGGDLRAEYSVVKSFAEIDQGMLAASIPYGSRAYDIKQGDILVPLDFRRTYDQIIDTSLPEKRAAHKWVTKVLSAYYLFKETDGSLTKVEVTVDYDFHEQQWILPADLPPTVQHLSIRYQAAPAYGAQLDNGEARASAQGEQPLLVLLVNMSTVT